MIADGWRQCAIGQRTTQWCAEAERIRARGKTAQFDPEPDLSHCPYCGGVADCEPGLDSNFCRRCQRA